LLIGWGQSVVAGTESQVVMRYSFKRVIC